MSIQEVSTSIFEIQVSSLSQSCERLELNTLARAGQELRHTSSNSTKRSGSSSTTEGNGFSTNAVSEMDKALMNLDAKLEEVRRVRQYRFTVPLKAEAVAN